MYSLLQYILYFDFRVFLLQLFETLTFRTKSDDYYESISDMEQGAILCQKIER